MSLHLQAALNGGRNKRDNKNIPVSIHELTKDAVDAVKAGAGSIHLHPMDSGNNETLDPERVAETLLSIRSAVQVPVGISTGEWISGPKTLDMIKNWYVLPDFASVNIHESAATDVISILWQKGIGIEAGLWSIKSAQKFLKIPTTGFIRILIEPMESDTAVAIKSTQSIIALLQKNEITIPLLLHGQNENAWKILAYARAMGLSSRIGFEDTLWLPDGKPANSNCELIDAALMF
ncbi:3-keto-5-aminohexanoate cleavage protein [Fulvivirga ulvae]|uniref:3-keto-5-aminohexanoate cleavage protein n=1 Tax=Fulvivirga ulvae TaxID=2904245 RepID=UPI001F33830A|nr:3-keto-5-aminohexanoate cleavage protein [Fulvivirga ulvae]UII33841.1 3-keto-5-aminohexanoate cleavage protein [Fulvivirga ulvae]